MERERPDEPSDAHLPPAVGLRKLELIRPIEDSRVAVGRGVEQFQHLPLLHGSDARRNTSQSSRQIVRWNVRWNVRRNVRPNVQSSLR